MRQHELLPLDTQRRLRAVKKKVKEVKGTHTGFCVPCRWPDFHVILLQEGSASDSACPMRAVWAPDTHSVAAFFADPSFRASEFWLGGKKRF
jgi:hypothetical protein